jgi:hypothetical protein
MIGFYFGLVLGVFLGFLLYGMLTTNRDRTTKRRQNMAWVRSQDKKVLINTLSFWIQPLPRTETNAFGTTGTAILVEDANGDSWRVGTFPTEEAALAELDQIERWFERGGSVVYQIGDSNV